MYLRDDDIRVHLPRRSGLLTAREGSCDCGESPPKAPAQNGAISFTRPMPAISIALPAE